ncbi:MAG: hypothetical protein DME25_13460 [Verrucomicrobia bacterium]|nr:MAG: hypothetical protein DME25_13460 [Verrucomicrobiota bacterium]
MADPLKAYQELQKNFLADVKSERNQVLLGNVYEASIAYLAKAQTKPLRSLVPGKAYFAFTSGRKLSRAVNQRLFVRETDEWKAFRKAVTAKRVPDMDADRITRIIYTVAASFFCFVDLTKEGDQKTPGTFFEYLIGHLFAWRLGVNPKTRLPVLNLDMEATLPTDFVFDLGPDRAKFHLPVKVSTRERVIQVWAHQRVLNGVYGTGRFLGTPVILTETKTDKKKGEVIEICLPDQWRIYQMHIAQLKRIYYLDLPASYARLNEVFPPLSVKPFGHFFAEADTLPT